MVNFWQFQRTKKPENYRHAASILNTLCVSSAHRLGLGQIVFYFPGTTVNSVGLTVLASVLSLPPVSVN